MGSIFSELFNNWVNAFEQEEGKKKPIHLPNAKESYRETAKYQMMDYIKKGELDKLNLRYKMLNRDIWYNIPHICFPAPLLFFKRSHLYPRLIKNEALFYATDSAYYVTPKASFSENGIVSSF